MENLTTTPTDNHKPDQHNSDWQRELAASVCDLPALCRTLQLPPPNAATEAAADVFPLLVPRSYLSKIEKGNPHDPLLLQIIPQPSELLAVDGFCRDPLGELAAADSDWLCKYPNRSLILTSNHCVVNCRFCFRRYFFTNKSKNVQTDNSSFERLNEQKSRRDTIEELILSGGDPLTLTDSELATFIGNAVKHLPNLQRVRIHSRVPVVIPKRLTESLAEILCDKRVVCYLVLHINHPREADNEFAERIKRFTKSGIPIMSQTVLLKNVNDNATTLIQLVKRLANLRI
ncbi:MAG: KamA family radical SAM protein, partial [Planctomycetaceae bacterium]|nr:KamA family radical SAM protein [Planctomycetaceae bacterium]